MDHANSVGSLFRACDLDGSGFIDETELASICPELSNAEVKDVFKQLDKDGDGKISVDEFSRGFKEINDTIKEKERRKSRPASSDSLDETNLEDYVGDLDEGLKSLSWYVIIFIICVYTSQQTHNVAYNVVTMSLRRCNNVVTTFLWRCVFTGYI